MSKFMGNKRTKEILGVSRMTLYKWEELGKIETIRTPGGQRLYNVGKFLAENSDDNEIKKTYKRYKICYCRVSSYNQKEDLKRQVDYMKEKYLGYKIVKDIGSGLNFKRKGLIRIIGYALNKEIEELVLAYKDRLCRFGYDLIKYIIEKHSNGKIITINNIDQTEVEEMTEDIVSIMNVFSAKMNGMRKYKTKKQSKKNTSK